MIICRKLPALHLQQFHSFFSSKPVGVKYARPKIIPEALDILEGNVISIPSVFLPGPIRKELLPASYGD